MSETLGGRLRKQREQRNISLSAIAEETKIGVPLLEALERDDVSRWPAGIFRRAFVRSYAKAVGLDADAVLQEFKNVHPEPVESASASEWPSAPDAIAEESRGLRRRFSSTLRALATDRGEKPTDFGRLAASDRPLTPPPPPAPPTAPAAAIASPTATSSPTATEPARPEPAFELNLRAAASVCTRLAQVRYASDLEPMLDDIRKLIDARGLIVWCWRDDTSRLAAAASSGYSTELLAQLPTLSRDADNATAAAFRSSDTTIVGSGTASSSALVVPIIAPDGVVGVLAIELPAGRERESSIQSAATIWAAQLAAVLSSAPAEDLAERKRAV